MKKTYFAYIRVSTKKQGNGASLTEQRSAITAFAQRNGLQIVKWFSEKRTAAKAGRREFTDMVRELRSGRATGVIIHKVDRSARNGRDWVEIGDLVDEGIEVRFAHDDLDIRTRGGRLTADIQAVIAADFIRNNREEVKKCMYGWLKQGHYPWPAPPGYLNQGKRRLKTVDPVRGPLVVRAFELYASGRYTVETLAAEMARQGLTTRTGRPLARDAISKMLRNPFYAGTIRIQKTGAVFEGKHVPLVARRLFDKVQEVLNGRVVLRTAEQEIRLRRLIRCANCPRTLTGEIQRGHTYYRCHSRSCPKVSIRETVVEEVVLSKLALLEFDDRELEEVRDIVSAIVTDDQQANDLRASNLERDLANIGDRMDRLTDAMIDGLIDKDAFNERKASLMAQRHRLQDALATDTGAPFWASVLERFEHGSVALQSYISGNDAEKRDVLISLGSNILAHGKNIDFSMSFPFSELLKWRAHVNGGPAPALVRTCDDQRAALGVLVKSLKAPDVPPMAA